MNDAMDARCAPAEMVGATSVEETDRLYRKVGVRLLPILIVAYMLAYMDRVNISFAKLQMQGELGMSDAAYGFAAGVFFLGYVLFEVPSNLLLVRIGARRTLSRIMVLWGLTSAAMFLVHGPALFYVLRFVLGVFEAGFGPGVLFYLTLWYGRDRRGRIMAYFLLAGPVAGVIGGPVATWILTAADGAYGLSGWQWMFLLEGLPCVLIGLLIFLTLDDKPATAAWLTDRERQILSQAVDAGAAARHSGFGSVLRDPRIYGLALSYFCMISGLYAVSFWLPTLLRSAGLHDTLAIGAYSTLPYVAAIAAMVLSAQHSDRSGERRWHSAGACLLAGAALTVVAATLGSFAVSMTALVIATAAAYAAYTVFWAIPPDYLRGTASAGGIAFINSIGLLGGFVSPTMIGAVKDWTGSLSSGLAAIGLLLVAGGAGLALNRLPVNPKPS